MSNQEWPGSPYGSSHPPPLTAPQPPFQPVPSFQPSPTPHQQFASRPPSSILSNTPPQQNFASRPPPTANPPSLYRPSLNPPPVGMKPNPFAPPPPQFAPPPRFGSPYPPQPVSGVPPPPSTVAPPPSAPTYQPGGHSQQGMGMVGSYQDPYGQVQQQYTQQYPQQYPQAPYASQQGYAAGGNLAEEFESLSISTTPGGAQVSMDSLPRPLADDEPSDPLWMNCHPRYFEMTTHIPNAHSLAARWHLPLGAVVHPLAEAPPGEEVPVVDFGSLSIIRCRRCRTYINPYSVFTDQGMYWRCSTCNLLNEVPPEYVCPLDEHGKRHDVMQRKELCQGSVDFIAPVEYMVRAPMPPSYFFLIDVSYFSVRSGMLQVAVDTIKSCLNKLPGFPRTRIGFMTYDSTLHFYNLKSSLTQAQMHVVGQIDDAFLPLPDDLMVNLSESRAVVDSLLDCLPQIHQHNDSIESAFGPALQATISLMGDFGGKLMVFQSTLPSLGVGRLKLRGEDARLYQSDREHTVRVPEESFYKHMAAECSKAQICVNLYAFSEKYIDLASLGTLSKYTGGQVYYYQGFDAAVDAERLRYDLSRDLTRETVWEAVMRVRCGKGIKYNIFHGHLMLRSSDLCALPAVDCDKAFSVLFSLEDTLLTDRLAYFQIALLYTSSAGERRIRVHTAAIPIVQDLQSLYQAASLRAIVGVMSRLAVEKTLNDKLENARQLIQVKMVNSLREFRNLHSVRHQLLGRMIFPENLKLLPLYVLALWKSAALRGGYMEVTADERSAAGYEMMTMSVPRLMQFLYPTLIRLDQELDSPKKLPLSLEMMSPEGAFLLADGNRFVIWLGGSLPPTFAASLLGPVEMSDMRKFALVENDSKASKELHSLINKLKKNNPACYQPCLVVRQGEAVRENQLVYSRLVEDRITPHPSYAEWILQVHRQVQQKM